VSHPYDHAVSSARKFGGTPDDYIEIHSWFDASKAHLADWRHRALRHHTEGIFMAETIFGVTFTRKSDGKTVRTRIVGEQHVVEDLGWIPTVADWFSLIPIEKWMGHRDYRLNGAKTVEEALSTKGVD
jgi:hypothetical protein